MHYNTEGAGKMSNQKLGKVVSKMKKHERKRKGKKKERVVSDMENELSGGVELNGSS